MSSFLMIINLPQYVCALPQCSPYCEGRFLLLDLPGNHNHLEGFLPIAMNMFNTLNLDVSFSTL
jgi:hypothetical protein